MPLRPLLALLTLAATWGGSYLLIAVALRSTTPATLTLLRFVPAALLVAALAHSRGHLRGLRGRWRAVLLLALVQQAAPMLLIAIGERSIPSGLAGTLIAVTPLWGALLAPALGGPRPTPAAWAGLLVGLLGVALLLGATTGGAGVVGCLLVLLAALGYAVGRPGPPGGSRTCPGWACSPLCWRRRRCCWCHRSCSTRRAGCRRSRAPCRSPSSGSWAPGRPSC
jgi:drug/metabolite transporter (DMT)-like permease